VERGYVESVGYQKVGKTRDELADGLRWLAVARTEAHFHPGSATRAGRKTLSNIHNIYDSESTLYTKFGSYKVHLELIRQSTRHIIYTS
jgi:hypothetical protein